MKIGVPRESAEGENRVALVPESVKSLLKKEGVEVVVESGAGEVAGHPDAQYEEAGAKVGSHADVLASDLILHVAPLSVGEIGELRRGQYLISHLSPLTSADTNQALASAGVSALAMELIPRTTRAQAMDALSSQATAAGYAATLIAARESGRFWGMLTTAAGTIRPVRVLVLGA
jgi:NAD(P) transhydrogenase subunit alpha